ncbi:pyridine nucleotide-disulfide oxidoreductase/dicluster-binding protein [Sulfurospirillum multivorans]|uniref:FeS oxidoreductase n=2 Tax=Sulfurospirillum multivorans TaxID=66821 RepID=A0AA86AM59_SULMK|nr:pyridine nucleotide-disulfide oxidoreductase/dicluster-binding protein [Sulfurospirillum multivorans]AHJ13355.1 putative FeS oxidoreductase [Sulfurospirillum multivorans DSM 12446]QEH06845.1 putative FeS oxidoreductase [Sulfurospirillum multivorans]
MDLDALLEISNHCIHSEPPVCVASCPVHMDVIAFAHEIEQGDFAKAYKVMETKIPFSRLMGKICDHPCESRCVRKEVGGSIRISELEKTVIDLGYTTPKKPLLLPKNKGTVAIIGGGLSGCVTAIELDKKGYKVTIYEKTDRLGGSLWDYEGKGLETAIIEEELSIISKKGITVCYNTEVTEENLKNYSETYDAVYLGTGVWSKAYAIHPETFQVNDASLFIGGKLQLQNHSLIFSASSGKRAAVSIDRHITKTSMLASREREGVFETKLDYKIDTVKPTQTVVKRASLYSENEAQEEASRCLKCQCDACIKACVHMQRFNITPDRYIRSINHNERIVLGNRSANLMINSCTQCGLCKEVCPIGIGMADIIHATRQSMVERKKMPISAHDFALKDMQFSHSDYFSLVRKQPSKEQSKNLFYYPVIAFSQYARGLYKGSGKTGYLFYPGCQLSSTHTDYIGAIYKHLVGVIKEKDADNDVGLYLGCCGAPADWAGRLDLMPESVEKIHTTWEEMGQPTFILACSSCASTFEKYLPMIKTISLWEVFASFGLPEVDIKKGKRELCIHDACATRHNSAIHESVRSIVKTLGYTIQELEYAKEKAKCCGYGGLVACANPEQAEDFVKDRIDESEHDVLVYCAMCKDMLVKGNKRAYHILDIIYGNEVNHDTPQKMPTLSERQNNRKHLKQQLLKEIWNEEESDMSKTYDFTLHVSDEITALMEKRFILLSDVEKVVEHSLTCKERFYNPETLDFLARLRVDNVTFWVKYEESGSDITVKDVYSHRMEVVED